jgi:hypothetical protein
MKGVLPMMNTMDSQYDKGGHLGPLKKKGKGRLSK